MGARSRDKEANRRAKIDKASTEEEIKESDDGGKKQAFSIWYREGEKWMFVDKL